MKKLYIFLAALLTLTTVYAKDMTGVRIYINPGHGGYDGANDRNVQTIPYALGDTLGFWESWSNLRKGLALRDQLQAANATVYMSRTQNRDQDDRLLSEIAEEANANNVDAFLSIHSNALTSNTGTNYLLLLFHGYDNPDPANPVDSLAVLSKGQAAVAWPRLVANPNTVWTHYTASTNIRGDFSFYGNTSGLGVLRPLTVPGFLSEGSFHDYKPETHRLLNDDYRKLEAERFYRYFCDYFKTDLPATGTISGWVKGKDQRVSNPLFVYKAATDDQWLPLNGAKVKLMNAAGDSLDSYTVDTLYNGIYAFHNLTPGTYKLRFSAAEHQTKDTTVTVTTATETSMRMLLYNPNLPIYKEIPPDYPTPAQEGGVIPMSHYNFEKIKEANPTWLNGADIRKAIYKDEKLYVLTEEPKIHIVNATTFDYIKEMDISGVSGGMKTLSDINFTSDGYLLACNKDTVSLPETKDRYFKMYTWDDDNAAPRVLFKTQYQGNWSNGIIGETFAVSGARWKHTVYVPSVTSGSSKAVRIVGFLYEDSIPLGYKYMLNATAYTEANWGQKIKFTISPSATDKIIVDGEKMLPTEFKFDWTKADRDSLYEKKEFAEVNGYTIVPVASGSNYFRSGGRVYMAAPNSNADASNVGVALFDIGDGLNKARKVSEFLPAGGLGSTPSPYMFATGKARNYDMDLIVLADKQGLQRYSTVPGTNNANLFASELRVEEITDGYKLHFTLNDKISGGQIRILDGENVIHTLELGALLKGKQSIDVITAEIPNGTYQWAIDVHGDPIDRPFKYSDDAMPQLAFFYPRGVAADQSFESPYFGRLYVTEAIPGVAKTGRTTQDGVYILDASLTDVTNQGANAYVGGTTWSTSGSPMRPFVAEDGKVYVSDWSDAHPGVWIMDPANPGNPFTQLFSSTLTKATSGLSTNSSSEQVHGSISHIHVSGTGADTKLFTFDEDYWIDAATNRGHLLQYNIGNLKKPWDAAPSAVVYNDGLNGNLQQNYNSNILPDGRGGWWISQARYEDTPAIPSLIHVNATGSVDFNSGKTLTLIVTSMNAGLAINKDYNQLAIAAGNKVKVYSITYSESGVPDLKQIYTLDPVSGANVSGISYDKAGNLYVVGHNATTNTVPTVLQSWALPKAENIFTTPAPSVQTIVVSRTGLKNVDSKGHISVYPNPVREQVTISSSESELQMITIVDVNGKLIRQERITGLQKEMNLSDLASGVYILRIKTHKGIENVRILKN